MTEIKGVAILGAAREDYGPSYDEHFLAIYKMFVGTAESVSQRRLAANSFFLTLNSALIGFASYVGTSHFLLEIPILSSVGLVVSYAWYKLIQSYRDLNSAKFRVIHAIEEHLPVSVFEMEWKCLSKGHGASKYKRFTQIERIVPWAFFFLHSAVFVAETIDGML